MLGLADRKRPAVHGIYRLRPDLPVDLGALSNRNGGPSSGVDIFAAAELHPKNKVAMQSFGYVGAANDTHTWKLPYLLADGITPDAKRLPTAIQCILSNYRGAVVDIREADVGDVLVRLGTAAVLRKMPCRKSRRRPPPTAKPTNSWNNPFSLTASERHA